jgi:Fe2+ or Zn2+ uptake regulation protein
MTHFDINDTINKLQNSGIRPSIQRLKILEYLHQHVSDHPTADEIFSTLSPEIPTLSRATVYNTLHSFYRAGLVNCLSIEGIESHYDVILEHHGHFKCHACGRIFDFPISIDSLNVNELKNFQVEHKNVIFTGICPDCQIQLKKGETK